MMLQTGRNLLLLLCAILMTFGGMVSAGEKEDPEGKAFWDAWRGHIDLWEKTWRKLIDDDRSNARKTGGKLKYVGVEHDKMRDKMATDFINSMKDGNPPEKGMKFMQDRERLIWRIQSKDLGYKVDDLEKELRDLWNNPLSQSWALHHWLWDFASFPYDMEQLYNRYIAENRLDDAIRISKEIIEKYKWIWELRDWYKRLADAQMKSSSTYNDAVQTIGTYIKDYGKSLEAFTVIRGQISFLIQQKRWTEAQTHLTQLLSDYKGCHWEPDFLHLMEQTLAGRSKDKADEADTAQKLTDLIKYCCTTFPHDHETADAIADYADWVLSPFGDSQKDAGLAILADFMQKYPESTAWSRLWGKLQSLINSDKTEWMSIKGVAASRNESLNNRRSEMKQIKDEYAPASYMRNLSQYIQKYPDSEDARAAVDEALKYMGKKELVMLGPDNVKLMRETLIKGFPNSPAYLVEKMQRLGNQFAYPFADFINQDLIKRAKNPLQEEWHCYMDAKRATDARTWSVPAMKTWVAKFPKSFSLLRYARSMVGQANGEGDHRVTAEIASMFADKEYLGSIDGIELVFQDVRSFLRAAPARERKSNPKKYGEEGKEDTPAYIALKKDFAREAQKQADLLDKALKKFEFGISPGLASYAASTWGDDVQIDGKTGKQILREKYAKTGFYYLASAYKD